MDQYQVIGIMSGSSLDGLDICCCHFFRNQHWSYRIEQTETISLPDRLKSQLAGADQLSHEQLHQLDINYGTWIAEQLDPWIKRHALSVDLIGIHGHTVFHNPTEQVSLQIGNGKKLAEALGVPVVDNFRMADILAGGQGAPLVPVGEHYLFPKYNSFINLGGIANIAHHRGQVTAWDIAPCNQVFNHFANKCGQPYDLDGLLASEGEVNEKWLQLLSEMAYFRQSPPKSLSNQWTQEVLREHPLKAQDCLASYCEFLSNEIARSLKPNSDVLITGGGAFNKTLIRLIKAKVPENCQITVPDKELVEFKEALIFGFLAVLRKLNIPNVFATVTGAQKDTVSGDLHVPNV